MRLPSRLLVAAASLSDGCGMFRKLLADDDLVDVPIARS
jgi:hypothetical protein